MKWREITPAPTGVQAFYGPGWMEGRSGTTRLRSIGVERIDDTEGVAVHVSLANKGEPSGGMTLTPEDARWLAHALSEAAQ
jgi:hypothetical protein